MKQCIDCNTDLIINENWTEARKKQGKYVCMDCWSARDALRMYINGKEISKSHPLHKPGRYKAIDDAWSHVEIDKKTVAGEVYIIRNRAWTNWLKIGKAVLSEDRLNGYQTGSPFRDYVLEYYEEFDNRHEAEKAIHRLLEKHKDCHERRGEWFKTYIPVVKEVMNEYRDSLRHRDQQHPQQDLVLCN